MSLKDYEMYGVLAKGLVDQPLHLALPTNTIKLMAGRRAPGTPYLWVDPPWELFHDGKAVATAADYPDPDDPEYQPKHDAWGATVRPLLERAVLKHVTGLPDGCTDFEFTEAVRLRSVFAGPSDESSWYDDWYAK